MAESKSPRRGRPRGATKVQDSVSFDKETKEMLNRIVSTRDMGKSDFINSVVKEAATHVIGEDKPMVLTVTNFKGGAAKTITSACLAVCFAQAGRKVLAIDLDPQANLSQYFRVVDPTFKEPTITDVMLTLTPNGRRKTLDEVIKKTAYENISILHHLPKRRHQNERRRRRYRHQTPACNRRSEGPLRLRHHRLPA